MIEKIKTALWFSRRPSFWPHAIALGIRKLQTDHDCPGLRSAARQWAAENAVTIEEALERIGLSGSYPRVDDQLLGEAQQNVDKSGVMMGGAGALDLLHMAVGESKAARVIETGVAYGWSSLAILAAMQDNLDARLVSVDMPYPKMGNEPFVGIAVPERLRAKWTLIRLPDRPGINHAIRSLGGKIDLCHYDSDKSWWGRRFAFPILWDALVSGGIFISDDIQDNLYFMEFIPQRTSTYAVIESQGKYVGIAKKLA